MWIVRLNKKGFTIVEIMIVVAVIGLLATIAIPSFIKVRDEANVTAVVADILSTGRMFDAVRASEGDIISWAVLNKYGIYFKVKKVGRYSYTWSLTFVGAPWSFDYFSVRITDNTNGDFGDYVIYKNGKVAWYIWGAGNGVDIFKAYLDKKGIPYKTTGGE